LNRTTKYNSELIRIGISVKKLDFVIREILMSKGCSNEVSTEVSEHLIHSDWSGVESHGSWRIIQYDNYYNTGYLKPHSTPELIFNKRGACIVDGHDGIGIPAMRIAAEYATENCKKSGISAVAVKNVGHTGRLGAFTEKAAQEDVLMIIIGGGGRKDWRLVAPFGGSKALMSTNPYSIGVPGGDRGPVVMDFATSAVAAGWIYGAKLAGAELPENVLIDKSGNPTRNPQDYFDGGAILTAGGAKGYAMAVTAEMIAEAMLGPVTTECNWLIITLDCSLYREKSAMQKTAEEILTELRECPPIKGFEKVEIPGERERGQFKKNFNKPIQLPLKTWQEIEKIAQACNINTKTLN
jgi:LDH2 family malate/lactate/ureidoglycolate dehydrogenase